MSEIYQVIKELILFALVWKTLIYLCPQKWIREYGKAIMGICLTILCMDRFLGGLSVDIDTIKRQFDPYIAFDRDFITRLFTLDEEIKTGIDNLEIKDDNEQEIQINQGLGENDMKYKSTIKIPEISLKNEISTIDVENIQSIKNE